MMAFRSARFRYRTTCRFGPGSRSNPLCLRTAVVGCGRGTSTHGWKLKDRVPETLADDAASVCSGSLTAFVRPGRSPMLPGTRHWGLQVRCAVQSTDSALDAAARVFGRLPTPPFRPLVSHCRRLAERQHHRVAGSEGSCGPIISRSHHARITDGDGFRSRVPGHRDLAKDLRCFASRPGQ